MNARFTKAEDNGTTLDERLVYARNKKGLNQKQLAELIGVRRSRLCSWEKGRRAPDVTMIRNIAKVLEVSEDWLTGNADNSGMEMLTETPQYMKLTKEQRQLVADNEKLIGVVFKIFGRSHKPVEVYSDIYGDAAIGLCRAAKIYDENDDRTATFSSFAFDFVQWAVLNHYRKAETYSDRITSLNKPINEDDDELGSLISSPDEWEQIEYNILVESVYQKVEPVLSAKERESFRLWLHGMSSDEIAKTVGASQAAVKDRTEKARKKCRDIFSPDEMFA